MSQTVILNGAKARAIAHQLIDAAPYGTVATFKAATRTNEQNALMWALLSEVSRAKPEGRRWTSETWKCAFMHSLGHQVQFCEGLDGSGPFPLGFRSSRLSKSQMADLITVIEEYGARHGVVFHTPSADGAEHAEAGNPHKERTGELTKALKAASGSQSPASAKSFQRAGGF